VGKKSQVKLVPIATLPFEKERIDKKQDGSATRMIILKLIFPVHLARFDYFNTKSRNRKNPAYFPRGLSGFSSHLMLFCRPFHTIDSTIHLMICTRFSSKPFLKIHDQSKIVPVVARISIWVARQFNRLRDFPDL
jgi:hypothetical protein